MKRFPLSRRALLIGGAAGAAALGVRPLLRAFRSPPAGAGQALDADEEFDVCIIGSGPAGVALGNDLVAGGRSVVILESGFDPRRPGHPRVGQLDAFRLSGSVPYPLPATRLRALGGASNLWSGRCSRLHPLDFEPNAYTPTGAAWPIRYADLEAYYAEAEQTLRVHGRDLSSHPAPRSGAPPFPAAMDISELREQVAGIGLDLDDSPSSHSAKGGPVRVVRDWLPAFSTSATGKLVSGATVTGLEVDAAGAVVGAVARGLEGEQRNVRARHYVVACGAIESARLLLLSRSARFPAGIGNDHDGVGRFFNEHPNIVFWGRIGSAQGPPAGGLGRTHQLYDAFKREGFGSVLLVCSRAANRPGMLRIGATVEMRPVAENRVTLREDVRDALDNPGLNLHFSFSEDDERTFARARATIRDLYAKLDAREVEEDPLTWSHHHLGTCRMGSDPRTSVVDRDLRVHGAENLYVLSSAVFVTGGAAHPTLGIVALAHRLAEHLASRLSAAR